MARLAVFVALFGLGVVLAKPTPPGKIPCTMKGVFENVHEKEQNFLEFVKFTELPETLFKRENKIGYFEQDGKYVQRFEYWPKVTYDLPFKLGEQQTTKIGKHNYEYEFTLEDHEESPILRTKYRQVDGEVKFTVEQTFSDEGVQVTYTRENIVAKRFYRRALPAYALGAYEADESTVNDEDLSFYNQEFPLPSGQKWDNKMKFSLGKKDGHYVDRAIASPEYHIKIPFELGKKHEVTVGNTKISYKYNISEITPEKTTMMIKFTKNEETNVYTVVFDHETATISGKSSKGQYEVRFRKVVPWMLYGKFEDISEKAENWEEFIKGFPDQPCKNLIIDRDENGYKMVKELTNGEKVEVPFKLNTPGQTTFPGGKTVKFNFSLEYVEDYPVLRAQNEIENTKFEALITPRVKPEGDYSIKVTYKRGDVVARRYYRRVLPEMVIGKFENTEQDAEYTKFSTTMGLPEVTTVEFSRADNGKYTKKLTTREGKTLETTFQLGLPTEFTCEKTGKKIQVIHFGFGTERRPYMTAYYREKDGTFNYAVTDAFNQEGLVATYVYGGNVTIKGENILKRTFTRK